MKSRVMLVDGMPGRAALLEQALRDQGHELVARVPAGADLLEEVKRHQPDVVIIDMELPDRDTLESLSSLRRDQPKPIVMFAEQSTSDLTEEAIRAGVSAYVVSGLAPDRLNSIMEVAIARFREYHAMRRELEDTRSKLADRKDLDRAKGILMKRRGLSEDQAYQALRKIAMDRNVKIGEAARQLLAMADLLG